MRAGPLVPKVVTLAAVALLAAGGGTAGAAAGNSSSGGSGGGRSGAAAPGAQAGPALRADFNGDGAEDLAVGVPFERLGTLFDAGAVDVVYGSVGGDLSEPDTVLFTQDSAGITSAAEMNDQFGGALATGDFDADGFDDLAVGSPGEAADRIDRAGIVHVLYGSPTGLSGAGSQLFTQDTADIGTTVAAGDRFGQKLATGDFDGDGVDDLAVGATGETIGTQTGAGAVNVLYGTDATGLTGAGSTLLSQAEPGVPSAPEISDQFGGALAAADFDGDGDDDLAVGVPQEWAGAVHFAGAVHAFDGSDQGVTTAGSVIFTQDTPGVGSRVEVVDKFGAALAAGDFDADGFADLAVGSPEESVNSVVRGGAVFTLPGTGDGLTGVGSQLFTQDEGDIGTTAEPFDEFGASLDSGDFDGDAVTDLAIGVPFEGIGSVFVTGAVNVLYGTATTGLSATGTQLLRQGDGRVPGMAETGDNFGRALAAVDIDGDGDSDLAVGAPFESVGSIYGAGAVYLLTGSDTGLDGRAGPLLHQDVPGVEGKAEHDDAFGYVLGAAQSSGSSTG
jgi:hypothetical protein